MGIIMPKSVTVCKGIRVNFGKTGSSLSFGTRRLRQTIHSSGYRRQFKFRDSREETPGLKPVEKIATY